MDCKWFTTRATDGKKFCEGHSNGFIRFADFFLARDSSGNNFGARVETNAPCKAVERKKNIDDSK